MATLGQLKARVIAETNRDDLRDELAEYLLVSIRQAIDECAAERFWFNEDRITSYVTVGDQYVDLPEGLRLLDKVWLVVGNVNFPLIKRETWDIEDLYSTPQSGQPTDFAVYQDQIRIWPTPTTAWQLIWQDLKDQTPLVEDDDTNSWLTYAYDLIDAKTRVILYRDYFRDGDGAAAAKIAEQQAYSRIKGETNRRIGTGRIKFCW